MPNVLILGSSRGLGSSLLSLYAARRSTHIYGTTRSSSSTPASSPQKNITYIPSIDIASETAGPRLVEFLKPLNLTLDIVIISAGYFATETFNTPNWAEELKMYTTSAIGPVFIIHALTHASLLTQPGAKIILVSSESGSIALRHEKEGGGNYGHHASKAALNMVGKLLSLDLRDKGIGVGIVHPGFMRTEMTRGVGFDKYWDEGGAVTPDEAAESLINFIDTFAIEQTGEYWAPRGAGDIGTAEEVLGKDLGTPLQLPW